MPSKMKCTTKAIQLILICTNLLSSIEGGKRADGRPNIIIMQPDDFQFFDKWNPPPKNPNQPHKEVNLPRTGLPNIERLRNDGVQMMRAYAASPMCGTSRYTTITGKYASRAAYSRAEADKSDETRSLVTILTTKLEDINGMNDCSRDNIAATFQNHGYNTAMIGKWHLSNIKYRSYTYDRAVEVVRGCGFSNVEGLYIENMAEGRRNFNNYNDGSFSHNMEWITYEAVRFIESSDEPFFLYFNPTVPHSSKSVTRALRQYSCRDTAAGTLNFDPMIEGMTKEYGSCDDYRSSIFARGSIEDEYGAIWLDDSVGALLIALKNKGILDNTIIVFQNDHGMDVKSSLYEGGLRIPQFIHYPSMYSKGTKFNAPVSTIDIGPTMLDFAGITPGYALDGMSWKDVIGNEYEEAHWRKHRCLFFEHQRDRAAICGCDKYLEIYNQGNSKTYQNAVETGYSADVQNLFDLCDERGDYITDKTTNMEADGLNIESTGPEKVEMLSRVVECHCSQTNWLRSDFSKRQIFSPECLDSPLKIDIKGYPRGCSWIKRRKNKMCQMSTIAKHCPLTCDSVVKSCSSYSCVDSTRPFMLKNNDSKECSFLGLGEEKNDFTCDMTGVSKTCRSTCGHCSAVTQCGT